MSHQLPPPEMSFEGHLPAGQQWFTVSQVAKHWGVSVQHVIDLVTEGRFTHDNIGPVDLSSQPGKTRATTRIPRACLLTFLRTHKL